METEVLSEGDMVRSVGSEVAVGGGAQSVVLAETSSSAQLTVTANRSVHKKCACQSF